MNHKQFGIQLSVLSGLAALGLWALLQHPKLSAYADISWLSLLAFIVITVIQFFSGRKTALSENKNAFTTIILGFMMAKMALAITIILIYVNLTNPPDKLFIIPFFCIYFIYTAFEVYFMMKIARIGV